MMLSEKKLCVYTCIIGNYEHLNEQPLQKNSGIDFVCITDNPHLQSDTWKILCIEIPFPKDSIRSQRLIKILPHKFLPETYDASLYIDNTVILKSIPERILNEYLVDADFALPTHSYRETVFDEFIEVSNLGLDDQSRIYEQLNSYVLSTDDQLFEKPYWTGILMRNHKSKKLQAVMDTWAYHVLRYSRRDQLSFNFAIGQHQYQPKRIEIDNFQSDFHSWPHRINIDREKALSSAATKNFDIGKLLQLLRKHYEITNRTIITDGAANDLHQDLTSLKHDSGSSTEHQESDRTRSYEKLVADYHDLITGKDRDLKSLQRVFDNLNSKHNKLLHNYTAVKNKLNIRSSSLNEMRSSFSWRITRQLRKLHRFFNKRKVNDKNDRADLKLESYSDQITPDAGSDQEYVNCPNGKKLYLSLSDLRAQKLHRSEGIVSHVPIVMWEKLIKRHAWTMVYDIGSNYGEMLVHVEFPSSIRGIIAVEPNPYVLSCLKKTIAQLDDRIKLLELAVTNKNGIVSFESDNTWSGMAGVAGVKRANDGHSIQTVSVKGVTLTQLLQDTNCSHDNHVLLKIDIEGIEIEALKVAFDSLIKFHHFAILIEVLHMNLPELDWLTRNFSLLLYNKEKLDFENISVLEGQELRQLLSNGIYHAEDVVLVRKS